MKVIFILLHILQLTYQLSVNNENCSLTNNDGSLYDLKLFQNKNKDYSFKSQSRDYRANFCGSLIEKCKASNSPAGIFPEGYNICLGALSADWNIAQAEYITNDNKINGLSLKLQSGGKCYNYSANPNTRLGGSSIDNYSTSYKISCNSSSETKLINVLKINNCNVEYYFESKHACEIISSSGLSSKTILLLTFLSLCLYISIFGYFNYKQNPEDGVMKAFPHRSFWREFVELVREGINKTYLIMIQMKDRLLERKTAYQI